MLFQFAVVETSNGYLPNLWNVDLAGTIHDSPQVAVNLTPNPDLEFIAGTNNVVARNLELVDGRERARRLRKKRLPKHWQHLAGRVCNHLLELGFRVGRKLRLPYLRRI